MKAWFESKTVWVNIIAMLVMVLDLASRQPFIPAQYVPVLVFVIGVLNVVLRVWFTEQPIDAALIKSSKAADNDQSAEQ